MGNESLVPEVVSNIGEGEIGQVMERYLEQSEANMRSCVQTAIGIIPKGSRTGTQVEVKGASIHVSIKGAGEEVQVTMVPPVINFIIP